MNDCAWANAHLHLLRYADELDPADRARVLEHLELCSDCRATRADDEAAAACLDAVPIPLPSPARLADLKQRILHSVAAHASDAPPCPHEIDLLARDTLSPHQRADLERHLTDCPPCRAADLDFQRVAQALDTIPLVERPRDLRDPILLSTSPRPTPRRRLVPFLALAATAAALLLAPLLTRLQPPPSSPTLPLADVAALKRAADALVRSARLPLARAQYALILNVTDQSTDPHLRHVAQEARHELAALDELDAWRASPADDPQHQHTLHTWIVDHPERRATWVALAEYERRYLSQPDPDPQAPRFHAGIPYNAVVNLSGADLDLFTRPLQQTILLQWGLQAADLGQLTEARDLYQRALDLDPHSPAGLLAARLLAEHS